MLGTLKVIYPANSEVFSQPLKVPSVLKIAPFATVPNVAKSGCASIGASTEFAVSEYSVGGRGVVPPPGYVAVVAGETYVSVTSTSPGMLLSSAFRSVKIADA